MGERKCGACTLCCTTLAVPELDKPNGVRCAHLTDEGCGIYEDRPQSCRDFECAWLRGAGDGLYTRPDYTGGVLTVEKDMSPYDMGEALVIYEDPNGKAALRSKYVFDILERCVEMGGTAVLVSGEERDLFANKDGDYALKIQALLEKGDSDGNGREGASSQGHDARGSEDLETAAGGGVRLQEEPDEAGVDPT